MSNGKCGLLRHITLSDSLSGVWGFALVTQGFSAPLHTHPVAEDYYYLLGRGSMHLGGSVLDCIAPCKVHVESNVVHAMTPKSGYVLLLYHLHSGPFNDIEYSYVRKRDGSFKNMKNFITREGRRRNNYNTNYKGVIIQGQTTVWNLIVTTVIAMIIMAIIGGVFVEDFNYYRKRN